MFKYEKAIVRENIRITDKFRDLLQPWQIVRRICKNDVVFCLACFQEIAGIKMQSLYIPQVHLVQHLPDKPDIVHVLFHKMNGFRSPRGKLVAYASRSREKIEDSQRFKIDPV